jgi:hypothetical protein
MLLVLSQPVLRQTLFRQVCDRVSQEALHDDCEHFQQS